MVSFLPSSDLFILLLSFICLALFLLLIFLSVYIRNIQKLKFKNNSTELELKFESVFESTSDAVIVADQHGIILQWNLGAETIFGFSKKEVIGVNLEIIIPETLIEGHRKGLQRYIDTGVPTVVGERIELVGRCKDGQEIPIEMSVGTWKTDDGLFFSNIIRDISERKETEEKINRLVYLDPLTGLPNRRLFSDQLESELEKVTDSTHNFSVLYIDLDHFKLINDTYGHYTGDQMLIEVAKRFQSLAHVDDTISRLGADEFILLLPNTDSFKASVHAQKILELFKQPFRFQQEDLFVTPSIGISIFPTDGTDLDSLVKNADIALSQAKNLGKNNFQFFTEKSNQIALRKSKLAIDIRKGLDNGEFFIHYQPQIDLKTEKIVGVEALVRWVHPKLGNVSPGEFIPVAEDTGSIIQIGEFVLRQACLQNKTWQQAGLPHFRVAVNISSHQFSRCNLMDTVDVALSESGLDPKYLELELTESIIQSSTSALATMQKLKALGIHLSIDDFGTGFSSLRYLKLFPVDTLKIDQYFIRNIITDPKDASLVDTIIKMADNLQLNVIAEGVETIEQLEFLKQKKCNQAQGYFFNRPLPPEEIELLYQPAASQTD